MGGTRVAQPSVSVVLTTYNGERYISQAVESILQQTFRDFEFLIVDDASTDTTSKILEGFQSRDSRITIITNETNLGGTTSLNLGLSRSRGKYVAIMDHDDVSLPLRFQAQHTFLETHPDIFLLGTQAWIIDEENRKVSKARYATDPDILRRMLPFRNNICHPSIMFRRDPTIQYRDKIRYVMDYDLYLRLLSSNKKLANLPDVLFWYRLSASSSTLVKREQQELFANVVRRLYQERCATGRDSYDAFDPTPILTIDPETSTDELVLREHAAGLIRANHFRDARRFCVKYFHVHGWNTRVVLIFCASFLGKRLMTLKRRIYAYV